MDGSLSALSIKFVLNELEEGILLHASVDGIDPAVEFVVRVGRKDKTTVGAGNNATIIHLAGFDLGTGNGGLNDHSELAFGEKRCDLKVLKGNPAAWILFVLLRLEIVETVVCEGKPTTFPCLDTAALFDEITLLLGVVKDGLDGVHVHLDLLLHDAIIDMLKELAWKVFTVVDAAIVAHKLRTRHAILLFDGRIVGVGIEHDDREGKDVCGLCARKGAVVARLVKLLCKGFHETIDLLGLTGKTKGVEIVTKGALKVETSEIDVIHKGTTNFRESGITKKFTK